VRGPRDTLPVPAEWNTPERSWGITWKGNRSATDTRAVRLDERDGKPVTLIRFSVGTWLAGKVFALAFCGFLITGIVQMWREWSASGSTSTIVVLGGFVLMLFLTVLQVLEAIAGPGELALSKSGVRLRPGASWTYLPWSAAREVTAELESDEGGWKRIIVITCDSRDSLQTGGFRWPFLRRAALRIDVGPIAINRELLYHVVRFYHERPEARIELGTLASIGRIRRCDFP
jgi:hypothetical protein